MKHKILKLSTVILPIIIGIAFISAGCQKDDIFELQIGDENAVIEHEVDGIEFKFCLLNEQGEPATVFNEGENFTFQFVINNSTGKSLIFHDYSFYEDTDFFHVHNSTKNYGRPFKVILGLPTTNEMRYIHDNKNSAFTCHWQDTRGRFSIMYGTFESLSKSKFKKGKYMTSFTHNFQFGDISTGKITFKINFEIE